MNDLASWFPAHRLTMAMLRRGFTLWVLTRAMLLTVGIAASDTRATPQMSPPAVLMLVLAVGGLGILESRRLNEHRFFANLGVSPVATALLFFLPPLLGEIAIGLVVWT